VRRRLFDDADEMAGFLEGWNIDLMQVEGGRFRGEHVVAGGGPVLLQGGRTSRALIQRGASPSRPTFCIPAQPQATWVFRGRETPAEEVTVVRSGEEFSVRSDAGFPISSLSVDERHLRRVAGGIGLERTVDAAMRDRRIRPSDDAMRRLRTAWNRIASGPDSNATEHALERWNRQLEIGLVRVLIQALATDTSPPEREAARALDRVVAGVESALDKRPRHAFSVRELADAVGVSERTLRRAVPAWYGVSTKKIVRARRLHGVRRELRAARPGTRVTVTSVAMQWGFEHLGRFAGDYRALFGETPSQTLAQTDW
jgi:AraC family ethanolamine operon transcriptional activator